MARKKSAEIAHLQTRLRAQTDLYMEAEPLLPIAEALREAINTRLTGEGASPLDVDGAFDAALAEVAEKLIASKLETLDPETVLRWYAEQVGDDVLREKLGRWAAAKAKELDSERRLDTLRKASAHSGRLDLTDVEKGARVAVGLFDRLHLRRARKESSIPPSRTIAFRLLDPRHGRAEVISDISPGRRKHESLTAHVRGAFGSLIVDGEKEWLEPSLQLHAPLGYDLGDGLASSPEVIGFVEIGDGLVIMG